MSARVSARGDALDVDAAAEDTGVGGRGGAGAQQHVSAQSYVLEEVVADGGGGGGGGAGAGGGGRGGGGGGFRAER